MKFARLRWLCLIVLVCPVVLAGGSASATVTQVRLDDGNDTSISQFGNPVGIFLPAGTCGGETFRALIEFPDALIAAVIPANVRINSVHLQFNYIASCNATTADYQVHRLTQSFDENTVTWASQPAADFTIAYGVTSFGQTSTGLQVMDITDLFLYWADNPGSNFGLMIKSSDESIDAALVTDSSEASSGVVRPTLIIDFDLCDPVLAIFDLIDQVIDLNLQNGISNGLDAKLDAALNALDDLLTQNDNAAINAIEAFINAVNAQAGNHISPDDATDLSDAAESVILQIVCE